MDCFPTFKRGFWVPGIGSELFFVLRWPFLFPRLGCPFYRANLGPRLRIGVQIAGARALFQIWGFITTVKVATGP